MIFTESNSPIYDLVVVGNGVLGLSLALTLARRKLRVALVGQPHRPWAASTAAGAMNGCFGEVTASLLKSEPGRAKLDLAVRARGLWDGWLAELAEETFQAKIQVANGTIVILNAIGSPGVDDVNFKAMREAMVLYHEPFEDLDPADVEWLDPWHTARPLRAVYLPNEHAVNTPVLLEQLERAFLRAGGTLVPELAVGLEHSEGRINGVMLASGTKLTAQQVVLAAGVHCQALIDTIPAIAARIPRLCSGMGVSVLLRESNLPMPPSVIRTTNRAFACGLHMVPRQPGEVYIGATNMISPVPYDTPPVRDCTFLLECATRQLRKDLFDCGIHKIQIGNRPVSFDGFPLLGATGLDGLWMMTGTYRDGLHLSPLLAAEMTRRILGEKPEVNLDMFKPVRPPLQAMTREEIIDMTVTHMIATGDEANWITSIDWPRFFVRSFRTEYEKFVSEIDDQYTPPAEILAMARSTPQLLTMLREYYAASRLAHPSFLFSDVV